MPEEESELSTNKKVDGIHEPKNTVPKSPTKKFVTLGLIGAILVFGITYFGVTKYASDKKAKDEAKKELQQPVKETPKTVTTEKIVYVGVSEGLRLRENPSYDSKILLALPYGAKLTVLEENSEWYKVVYGETNGWCSKKYTVSEKPKDLSIRDVDFSKIVDVKSGTSSIQPIQYADYNQDGQEEALISVLYDGSGGYKDFYIYGYKDNLVLTKYLDARPTVLPSAFVEGYQGHDQIEYISGKLVISYPVYKKEDPNCCPTGGKEYVYFKWDGKKFTVDSKENK